MTKLEQIQHAALAAMVARIENLDKRLTDLEDAFMLKFLIVHKPEPKDQTKKDK